MEDPKAKPLGLDAVKKGLAPDGSYLIVETWRITTPSGGSMSLT